MLPVTAQVEQLMQAMRVAGRADLDHSGLLTVLEDLAGFRVADWRTGPVTGGGRGAG